MRLFKRRRNETVRGGKAPSIVTVLLRQHEILDAIADEIGRAHRNNCSVTVLCVVPQALRSKALQPMETALAADVVSAQLRFSDRMGSLSDGTLVIVLPEAPRDDAHVIASRIAAQLAMRGSGARWRVGTSAFPDDGVEPSTMVAAALQRAQS
jgi:hypothetical protein